MEKVLKYKKTIIVLVLALLAYLAFDYTYPSGTWRYRITVEIDTPEGIKTGSAVREVIARRNVGTSAFEMKEIAYRTYGEAVVIDLGKLGYLFYPIGGYQNALKQKFPYGKKGTIRDKIKHFENLKVGSQYVSRGWMNFIFVDGLNSSKPFTRLDSTDFNQVLGEGISLKSVTVEITNDPVTHEISPILAKFRNRFGTYSRQSFQRSK